jgi:hypothetical protein
MNGTNDNISRPVFAWLGLLALTLLSLALGERFGHAPWMPLLVAAIIWAKGTMVARYFIESHQTHPFIAWVIRIFIALVPVALALITFLGQ